MGSHTWESVDCQGFRAAADTSSDVLNDQGLSQSTLLSTVLISFHGAPLRVPGWQPEQSDLLVFLFTFS